MTKRTFIIVTQDGTGFGWVVRLKEEGYPVIFAKIPKDDEDDVPALMAIGEGIAPSVRLEKLLKNRQKLKNANWIWDSNIRPEINAALRKEGFRVFGSYDFTCTMEHDRDKAAKLASKYGIQLPPTTAFTDISKGIKFVEAQDKATFVFKPDDTDDSDLTFVPEAEETEKANKELVAFMQAMQGKVKSFILQERKKGIEVNVECLYMKGVPVFAHANLECKKRLDGDLGGNTGCALDFEVIVPLDGELVKQTVGKMHEFYKKMNYTGFGDVNVIFGEDGEYFLEFCGRFGYNASPNLFFNLFKVPFGEAIDQMIDGTYKPELKKGFGSSITFSVRKPRENFPLHIPEGIEKDVYLFDGKLVKDQLLTTGYDGVLGIVLGHGYTIQTAWEDVYKKVQKIVTPNIAYRTDGGETGFPSSPVRRYEGLVSMDLIE